ncbi:MAG TPA: hypothetical protein VEK14_04005, partial [Rhodomicrobium sp.]|nr:hypothetical protein [Rhodomicrobium sp.]
MVFELSPPASAGEAWSLTVVHNFTGGEDGAGPQGGLIFDSQGNLYGTAEAGGASCLFDSSP